MDQQWRRFHLLFVLLTLWKHAIGYPGLNSQLSPRSLRYHKALSPRGFKSSSAALMTKNIPLDVHSNVAASGTYKSVSQTQSSPSDTVSASLVLPQNLQGLDGLSTPLQLHGSSSSNVKGMAGQSAGGPGSNSQYDFTYKYRTGPQAGGSGQLVSAQGGSSFNQAVPDTFSSLNFAPSVLRQSSNERLSSSSSQSGSDLQLGEISSQLHTQGSGAAQFLGASSQHAHGSPAHAKLLSSSGRFPSQVTSRQGSPSRFTLTSQDSSRSKLSASSSPVVSAQGGSASLGGLSSQSLSTSSQYSPVFVFGLSSEKASGSRGGSSQFAASHLSRLAQGVSSNPVGSYVQSQGSPGQQVFGSPQYASVSMAAAQTTSNQYNQGSAKSLYSTASMASPQAVSGQYRQTSDGALSSIQSSQLQPSVSSSSQGSQSSGAAWSQSRFSVPSASAPSKSLASGGRLRGTLTASPYSSASMPSPQSGSSRYSQATGSALSQSQAPQRWQPSAPLSSQGYKSSSTMVSQSSSQGAEFPSRFSLASGSGPRQLVSTQSASIGSAKSPSSSAQYAPAYSKPASSPLGVKSQFTRGQSLYASSSQSTAGGTLGSSIRHASAHREVGSIASQPQVAAGQYAPRPSLDVKVPVYRHDTSSGSSMSSRLQSQTWQPTTSRRVYSSSPTSGAAKTQTSISPQRVQSSSRLSSVAGGKSRLFTQSRGSYTGSSQSLGSVGKYTPGSPAYTKFGASSRGVSSQSTSGQSSSSQHSPLSTTGAGGQLTSSGFLSAQEESGSVGSSHLSQGALAKDALAPMDASMSGASQTAGVSSGIPVSDAALQSGSSAFSSLSSLQTLSASVPQSASSIIHLFPFGQPTGSMTQSSGSSVKETSEVVSSSQTQTLRDSAGFGASVKRKGLSGGSTSVLSSSYDSSFGQSAPVSKPSRGSLGGYYGFKG